MTDATAHESSYFRRSGAHSFVPTRHAGGAWDLTEQHFSPLGGLIVHEIERARAQQGRPALAMSRISFDILGRIAFEEFDIHVEVTRPGRTIELVEATVTIAGRSVVGARAWFLRSDDTAGVAGGEPDRLPHPDALRSWPLTSVWSGGYIDSIDVRPVGVPQPGRTTAWVATPVDLVADEDTTPLAAYIALVDTANGIAVRQDPTKWMFPNLDLTIHLYRGPEGPWTGLDTSVVFGHTAQGLTSTTLHDLHGPVGSAQQTLTLRPQPDQRP
ncbi:thioesterase family protein [Nocardia jejuensis]|uniref:thioesterase family protein n=1 Tax=Nocardia jejuensis TaxID=328049 RepID=UPI000832AC5D|nr:thioesterase family protein [Nocardia jejuensis]